MASCTVLLIEPEPFLRKRLTTELADEGTCHVLDCGHRYFAYESPPESVIHCDVVLLDADHLAVITPRFWAKLRVLFPSVPLVVLTNGGDDRVLEVALAAGITGLHPITAGAAILCRAVHNALRGVLDADRDLLARAKEVVLRPLDEGQLRYGGLTIDLHAHEISRWNQHIHVSPLEFKVLAYLAHQRGRPVCAKELLTAIWSSPPEHGGTLAQVHNCIKRLRHKLEPDARHPRYVLFERGRGYWLQDPTLAAIQPAVTIVTPASDISPTELIDI